VLFRAALLTLLKEPHAAVRHAVLCDEEGERIEAVSQESATDLFEVDVYGASYAAVVARLRAQLPAAPAARVQLRVRYRRTEVWVRGLSHGCYLVVVSERGGAGGWLGSRIAACADTIEEELR
jgi:hypothetical protein